MSDDNLNYYEIVTGKSRQNITADDVDWDSDPRGDYAHNAKDEPILLDTSIEERL